MAFFRNKSFITEENVMSKKFTLLKGAKYIIIALFLALSILSVILIGTVKINYNISDYLDESTDTKISLGIMEDEFSLISNVKVMVTGVSADEANEIKDKLKSIENVKFVSEILFYKLLPLRNVFLKAYQINIVAGYNIF